MVQTFIIPGIPKPQGRPRFARMGKFVKAYDPKESREHKNTVAAILVQQGAQYSEAGELVMWIDFFLPRPKAHYKTNGKLKDVAPLYCAKKPDLDNCIKALMDSAKGILWKDDSQVVKIVAVKKYAAPGDPPETKITVEDMENGLVKEQLPFAVR